MPGRLVLLCTSRRVAPGLLSWPAWQELREGEVLAGTAEHPQLPAVRDAGISVEVLPAESEAERARVLLDRAGAGRSVVWLAGEDGADREAPLRRALENAASGEGSEAPEIVVVRGSYDLPGSRLLDLVATMDHLRSPGGCPWDREQTHTSLAPHLLEEAYEAVEAVETGDLAALPEELGDVLLQVVFHARVAEERRDGTGFTIDHVAREIVDKLVRRHPHVFGDVVVGDAAEVKANWDAIKAAERAGRRSDASVVDGVPLAQPALSLAAALQKRAARAGLPDDLLGAPRARRGEPSTGDVEAAAPEEAAAPKEAARPGADAGAALFDLVARARAEGIDPEASLRDVARRFRDRLRAVEESAADDGAELSSLTPDEWRRRWKG